MKRILSLFVAVLFAFAVNATETQVSPGSGTLKAAVEAASAGDVLILADGTYSEPEVVSLDKSLTIKAAEDANPVIAQQYYMKLLSSAEVTFIGIKFDGGLYNEGQGANDHCIRPYDATTGKTLTVIDCEFCNWKSYILYPQRADRCADALTIQNCYFHDNKRCAVFTENVAGALGELTIENSTFANFTEVGEALIAVKNGGTETADQKVIVDHCTFYNYVKNSSGSYTFIDVRKSTDVAISNCIFAQPTADMSGATYVYGGSIDNCLIYNTTGHRSSSIVHNGIEADPLFVDAANGDYTLGEGSPALTAATDGGAIGDPRWVAEEETMPVISIKGSFNDWGDALVFTTAEDNLSASLSANIAAGNYEFKVLVDDEWRSNGYTYHRDYTGAAGIIENLNNMIFQADIKGDYTFTWIYATDELQITYPLFWTYFATAGWGEDTESNLVYDAGTGKATVTIGADKAQQWQAQVKYYGPAAETGKFYHFGLKLKANNDLSGVTLRWQDNSEIIYENQSISLEAGVEYVYDVAQIEGIAGNGILVLDFGYAKSGDIIEIYDIVIEEVEAPALDLTDGYYLIGLDGWSVYSLNEDLLFVANQDNEGEYVLADVTLAEGDQFKVVAVADNAITTWYPGEGANYSVDYSHAGVKDVYFRPDYQGGEGWHAGCIYVPETVDTNPFTTWFATGDTWNEETESYLEYNEETEKATVYIMVDKNAQWRAQVKYHGEAAEAGKYYHFGLKLKANNDLSGVTIKWQDDNDDPNLIFEDQTISLEADVEYVYDVPRIAGRAGNGILVLDFGFAKSGDIIEIYDIVIEETTATGVSNTTLGSQAMKRIENGRLVIMVDGVRYNAQGQVE